MLCWGKAAPELIHPQSLAPQKCETYTHTHTHTHGAGVWHVLTQNSMDLIYDIFPEYALNVFIRTCSLVKHQLTGRTLSTLDLTCSCQSRLQVLQCRRRPATGPPSAER